jgi:hypothetical protein
MGKVRLVSPNPLHLSVSSRSHCRNAARLGECLALVFRTVDENFVIKHVRQARAFQHSPTTDFCCCPQVLGALDMLEKSVNGDGLAAVLVDVTTDRCKASMRQVPLTPPPPPFFFALTHHLTCSWWVGSMTAHL